MSPWVLVLIIGWSGHARPVAIDMPSREVCEAALSGASGPFQTAPTFSDARVVARGICINREAR